MKFDIISLFPNYFSSPLKESLISKAIQKKLIDISITNLRDFAHDKHKNVDDTPYGGGAGMVLRADILSSAVKALKTEKSFVVLTDPAGKKLDQKLAVDLATQEHLIIVCGRYEGVDQRFKDKYVDLPVSIGDYVLNGGEVAALVLIDTLSRLKPGVLGQASSLKEESFAEVEGEKLLEYPQYTRPEIFEGETVPEILLSGNHPEIAKWRHREARAKTTKLRPDLLAKE